MYANKSYDNDWIENVEFVLCVTWREEEDEQEHEHEDEDEDEQDVHDLCNGPCCCLLHCFR